MYTMPLWTAVLSYFFVGRAWDRMDLVMAACCLVGVVLVSMLWDAGALGDGEGDDQFGGHGGKTSGMVGVACALGFAISNAVAAVVVNTYCRGESALLMTALSMLVAMVISGSEFYVSYARRVVPRETFFLDDPPWWELCASKLCSIVTNCVPLDTRYQVLCLVLLGFFMILQQVFSYRGSLFCISTDYVNAYL
jgi:drug/metabolite transporter (DMT)-like permease